MEVGRRHIQAEYVCRSLIPILVQPVLAVLSLGQSLSLTFFNCKIANKTLEIGCWLLNILKAEVKLCWKKNPV